MNNKQEPGTKVLQAGILIGFLWRLWPILVPGRLFQHWATEDGYLTLTIARNIAKGFGISVADGTVSTNGTQPLATFLYSIGFYLGDGSRAVGVAAAQFLQLGISTFTCWLLYKTVKDVLGDRTHASLIAAISAVAWFLNPVLVPHSMNCLETSLAMLIYLNVWRIWYRGLAERDGVFGVAGAVKLGLLMGLSAWGRIDAAFLMIAIGLTQLTWGIRSNQLKSAVLELTIMAGLAVASISPWLIYGKQKFGYWTPISGITEGNSGHIGGHIALVPSKIFEYLNVGVGVPASWETHALGVPFYLLFCLFWFAGVYRLMQKATKVQSYLLGACMLHLVGLTLYYGLFFGAPHFLSRFLAPMSLFTVPITFVMIFSCWTAMLPHLSSGVRERGGVIAIGSGALVVLVIGGQLIRHAMSAVPHPHWQVVEWVDENVSDETWLGAVQTGTLGFFHDRTLNFDGKVDPRALAATLENRRPQYIADSPAEAMVDWNGMRTFVEHRPIRENFRTLIADSEKNLGVMVRKGSPLDQKLLAQ